MKTTVNDYAGRIHKPVYVFSTIALFSITLLSVAARFGIRWRLRARRRRSNSPRGCFFGIDDAFLLGGVACITAATALALRWADQLYLTQALTFGVPGRQAPHVPPDWPAQLVHFKKWYLVCLLLLCGAVSAAKISLLCFFRRLVRRVEPLAAVWWLAAGVALVATVLSMVSYVVSCPYFDLERAVLVLPVCIVWQIRVRWQQKLALGASLCLTVFVLAASVVRVAGISSGGTFDSVWALYWQVVAANVALTINSATALRMLFVARRPASGAGGHVRGKAVQQGGGGGGRLVCVRGGGDGGGTFLAKNVRQQHNAMPDDCGVVGRGAGSNTSTAVAGAAQFADPGARSSASNYADISSDSTAIGIALTTSDLSNCSSGSSSLRNSNALTDASAGGQPENKHRERRRRWPILRWRLGHPGKEAAPPPHGHRGYSVGLQLTTRNWFGRRTVASASAAAAAALAAGARQYRLPNDFPRATLTGMRSVIGAGSSSSSVHIDADNF